MRALSAWAGIAVLGLASPAPADVAIERPGRVEPLPTLGPHHVVVADLLLRRSGIVDLDSGDFLGMWSTGFLTKGAVFPPRGDEFFVPETYYSRGSRGERTDVVTVYDGRSLRAVDEVAIPPKRALNVLAEGNATALDDGRFVVVLNMTPATSVSVVDTASRRFVTEVPTPGCALVYAAGPRSFFSLCADGSLLAVTLDDDGQPVERRRSEPFFDPEGDPLTEKGARAGDRWLFSSFEGDAVEIDLDAGQPRPGRRWSLFDDAERADGWRIGGSQHLAAHADLGRLYSLVHQGGADTHKQPGTRVLVYDLATRKRMQRIELEHPGYELLGDPVEFSGDWPWPFGGLADWLLYALAPNPGISNLVVTGGPEPLLVTSSDLGGSLALYDARSGEFLRRIASGNFTVTRLQAPWGDR